MNQARNRAVPGSDVRTDLRQQDPLARAAVRRHLASRSGRDRDQRQDALGYAPSMGMACGGRVPGALVQGREGRRAAEKLGRKLIRKPSRTPRLMVTDKPGLMARPGPGWA